jgi:hypothetical protein
MDPGSKAGCVFFGQRLHGIANAMMGLCGGRDRLS